jgi:hypothetical protein
VVISGNGSDSSTIRRRILILVPVMSVRLPVFYPFLSGEYYVLVALQFISTSFTILFYGTLPIRWEHFL